MTGYKTLIRRCGAICLSLAFLCLAVLVTDEAAKAQPLQGDQEIQAGGSLFRPLGQRGGNASADVAYGWYMTPAWQVGLRQGLNWNFHRDRSDVWTATTVPYVDYNFPGMGRFVPFVGGFLGAVWNDRDITGTIGPQAGVKAFLSPNTFLGGHYRYEWFFDDLKTRDIRDTSPANHVVSINLGYLWGGAGQRQAW